MWILFEWHFFAAYLLIVAAVLIPARFRRTRIVVLGGLCAIALAVWAILPMPWLSVPDGPYAVGTTIFRWVDESRPERATDESNDKRNVVAQFFYPAARSTTGAHSTYMDGLHNLPPYVSILPRFLLKNFGKVDTHSIADAPIATDRERWPLVVFSPGYGAPRSFYTSLITQLVSTGLVVLAIDHPYEAGVAELADGRIVGTVIRRLPNDPDLTGYMTAQQDIRVTDIRFALDQIPSLSFASRLDTNQFAAIGHSFGGASSIAAMEQDVRIKAAANIDGTPYGSLPGKHLDRPVLLIESDPAEGQHGESYKRGNGQILNNLSAAKGYRYALQRTNHYSFSDFPLFFSPPGRWLLSLSIGGSRDPKQTYRATVDLLTAFLYDPANLDQVAGRNHWILGGRVK
jgi:hypothetical protein